MKADGPVRRTGGRSPRSRLAVRYGAAGCACRAVPSGSCRGSVRFWPRSVRFSPRRSVRFSPRRSVRLLPPVPSGSSSAPPPWWRPDGLPGPDPGRHRPGRPRDGASVTVSVSLDRPPLAAVGGAAGPGRAAAGRRPGEPPGGPSPVPGAGTGSTTVMSASHPYRHPRPGQRPGRPTWPGAGRTAEPAPFQVALPNAAASGATRRDLGREVDLTCGVNCFGDSGLTSRPRLSNRRQPGPAGGARRISPIRCSPSRSTPGCRARWSTATGRLCPTEACAGRPASGSVCSSPPSPEPGTPGASWGRS